MARFVGFAPVSFTSALSGDRGNCRSFAQDDGAERFASDDSVLPVSQKPGAELCSLGGGGGCVGLGVDGEVGAEADEVRDQLEIAADEAKLATELLLRKGHVTGTPTPSRCGRLAYKPRRIMRM